MEPGGSMPHSQGLSNNSYPEPNHPNYYNNTNKDFSQSHLDSVISREFDFTFLVDGISLVLVVYVFPSWKMCCIHLFLKYKISPKTLSHRLGWSLARCVWLFFPFYLCWCNPNSILSFYGPEKRISLILNIFTVDFY